MALVRDAAKPLAIMTGDTLTADHPSSDPEIHDTKFAAAGINLHFVGQPQVQSHLLEDWFQWKVAYILYRAFVNKNLEEEWKNDPALLTVVDDVTGEPVVDYPVSLQGALQLHTDVSGQIILDHLNSHPYRVTYMTDEGQQWIDVEPGGEYEVTVSR